jgi:hypothetical protein
LENNQNSRLRDQPRDIRDEGTEIQIRRFPFMRMSAAILFACAACLSSPPALAGPTKANGFLLSYSADVTGENEAWRARVARAKARYQLYAARAVEDYLAHSAPGEARTNIGAPPVTPIMRDPTLREGDIYATNTGFMVFRGQPSVSHRPSDFIHLHETRVKALSLAIGGPAE